MKHKLFKNQWFVTIEKTGSMYLVQCRSAGGELHDKIRCDEYRTALEYYAAFCAVAKNH